MRKIYQLIILAAAVQLSGTLNAQHSVARQWNEALLHAIRNDFARPTVHARNLWHTSIAMYEAWASYTNAADHYFLGDSLGNYFCPFNDTALAIPANSKAAQEEAISYAAYRLLKHRFANSPGTVAANAYFDSLFLSLGYSQSLTSANYAQGGPAELGNYIAQEIIAFGYTDSSNEQNAYANTFYNPVNPTLLPVVPGNPNITDPNRWQPLTLSVFIDQSGNVIPINTPSFLSPEWGSVVAFALSDSVRTVKSRNGNNYSLYYNLPNPPYLDTNNPANSAGYKWGFRMVSKWSSHLDTTDGVLWDISPANTGNVNWLPSTLDSLPYFYDEDDGHDFGNGYGINPHTGQPYQPQLVKRGDYTRVLAEFWADGPDSETPPGHWFTILNYVNDHPQLQRKWRGTGPVLDPLEWDIKCYFTLAGAMHDAAVAAWAAKGWHDYIRPISAIRYMAGLGQSSDSTLPSYHPNGIELDSGYVELVDSTDALADSGYVNVGKIKLYAWKGPDSISDPLTDMAGVGWILAENWWPYQRPSFVTPPFAGYVSGHSTFSRAAAEVLTHITDDPYFPGGMGEFLAEKNKFLVFEEGPSNDVKLQWATYRDASDQCSLSRIWGGIHPPADDIPGRIMGKKVGIAAFHHARKYWENDTPDVISLQVSHQSITDSLAQGTAKFTVQATFDEAMDTTLMPQLVFYNAQPGACLSLNSAQSSWQSPYQYTFVYNVSDADTSIADIDVQIMAARGADSTLQKVHLALSAFSIEQQNPTANLSFSKLALAEIDTGQNALEIIAHFSEKMDTAFSPQLVFTVQDPTLQSLFLQNDSTRWLDSSSYRFSYALVDADEYLPGINIRLDAARDSHANLVDTNLSYSGFLLDTENPRLSVSPSTDTVGRGQVGQAAFQLLLSFHEAMDSSFTPYISFPVENPLATSLTFNASASHWQDSAKYLAAYNVDTAFNQLLDIDVAVDSARDLLGNRQLFHYQSDIFHIVIIPSGIGLPEGELQNSLSVYPNPLREGQHLQLKAHQDISTLYLALIDLKGKEIKSARLENLAAGFTYKLEVAAVESGVYLLLVRGQNQRVYFKVLIKAMP